MAMPMRAHGAPRLEDSAESVEDNVDVSTAFFAFCARQRLRSQAFKRNNGVARINFGMLIIGKTVHSY